MKCAKCLENYILSMWEFWPTIPSMLQLVGWSIKESSKKKDGEFCAKYSSHLSALWPQRETGIQCVVTVRKAQDC